MFMFKVWDAISNASITFGEETSDDDISYIVENDLIIASVKKELEGIPNLEVVYGTKVSSYHLPDIQENKFNTVCLENSNKYTCELLVSCSELPILLRFSLLVSNYYFCLLV